MACDHYDRKKNTHEVNKVVTENEDTPGSCICDCKLVKAIQAQDRAAAHLAPEDGDEAQK